MFAGAVIRCSIAECAGGSPVGAPTLLEAAITESPTSNIPWRLIGPFSVTVSRKVAKAVAEAVERFCAVRAPQT